eukprot:356690-Chlamydomonas_euryale.AAC.18
MVQRLAMVDSTRAAHTLKPRLLKAVNKRRLEAPKSYRHRQLLTPRGKSRHAKMQVKTSAVPAPCGLSSPRPSGMACVAHVWIGYAAKAHVWDRARSESMRGRAPLQLLHAQL